MKFIEDVVFDYHQIGKICEKISYSVYITEEGYIKFCRSGYIYSIRDIRNIVLNANDVDDYVIRFKRDQKIKQLLKT